MRASILAATLMLVGCNSSGPANDSKTSVPGSAAREPAAVPEIPPYVLDGLTAWRPFQFEGKPYFFIPLSG
jgi:hypothetical protein